MFHKGPSVRRVSKSEESPADGAVREPPSDSAEGITLLLEGGKIR